MSVTDKRVFISYRRADADGWALGIYRELKKRGFDVFYDIEGLSNGAFAPQLLENVRTRTHFLVLLKPTTLDRCFEDGDWMRQEIEEAMAAERNIVPILLPGFSFSAPNVKAALTGKLALLSKYHGHQMPATDDEAAVDRLVQNFLSKPLHLVEHPHTDEADAFARGQQRAADEELATRLRRTNDKNKRLADKLAKTAEVLAQFQCPHCGALKVESGTGRRPHYSGHDEEWDYATYECGYATIDEQETSLCRNSAAWRVREKIKEVKFSPAIRASTAPIRPFGDAAKGKLIHAWTKEIERGDTTPNAYAQRAASFLATGNAHDAIKDIYRSGERDGLRMADSGPLLKAMILHIKAEWARTHLRSPNPTPSSTPDRMPLVDLYAQAKTYGVDFVGRSHSILKFTQAVRQAAIDGQIAFWGRSNRHMFAELNRNEPLVPIERPHWADYQPEWITAVVLDMTDGQVKGLQPDNFPFRSYVPGDKTRRGYNDLHVDRKQAQAWLSAMSPGDFQAATA